MMKRLRNSPIFSSVRVGRCAMSTMCSFQSRIRYMTRAVGEVVEFFSGMPRTTRRGVRSADGCCAARPMPIRARADRADAGSDAAALRRTAAVVRLRRHVVDRAHLEAGGLQRADRGLAARTRALHEDVDLLHAVLLRLAG